MRGPLVKAFGDARTASAIGVRLAGIVKSGGTGSRWRVEAAKRSNGARVWVLVPLRPRTPYAAAIA